jgi:FtsP/CotA-like multicopper oxidase with cupredoxin domain
VWTRIRLVTLLAAAVAALTNLFSPALRVAPPWEDIDMGGLSEIRSRDGVLSTTLIASSQTVHIGAATFPGASYNGDYPGPVLRVRPGDRIRIHLINHLSEPTNLHFHGLRVTPDGTGDNMHISVPPGASFDYAFLVPTSQPAGFFWYHDHLHGLTEAHVMAGLSGAILIDGFAANFGSVAGLSQKMLVIKDVSLPGCQGELLKAQMHCRLISVNGMSDWHVTMQPGETQLWRICNQGANLWDHLILPGMRLRIIGRDGTPANRVADVQQLDVMPASRIDVLVTAPGKGAVELLATHMLTGAGTTMTTNRQLGTVSISGPLPPTSLPTLPVQAISFPRQADLRAGPVNAHRTVVFTEDSEAQKFFIDGKLFSHHRVDMRVPFGTVEEWTIKNQTEDFHEFHIHQLGFQVIEINGRKQDFDGYLDDVEVPEMGEVKLLVPFTDPIIIGSFMYHCHVLKHEDHGMMANIEVYRQTAAVPHGICRFATSGHDPIP